MNTDSGLRPDRCERCRFFNPVGERQFLGGAGVTARLVGECRRRAPSPNFHERYFPLRKGREDWCGEFEPATSSEPV